MSKWIVAVCLLLSLFSFPAFAKSKCGTMWSYDIWLLSNDHTPAELDTLQVEKPFGGERADGRGEEIYMFSADSVDVDLHDGTITAHVCGFGYHPAPALVVDIDGNVKMKLAPNWRTAVVVGHLVRDKHGKVLYDEEVIYGQDNGTASYRVLRTERSKK